MSKIYKEYSSEEDKIVSAYKNGQSMNSIAKEFNTYPTSIRRILEKHNVKLRHDSLKKGELYVKDGDKLIEWAKSQGRLVTKSELAKVIGKKRLSPSYFLKYPELGQYVKVDMQNELDKYYEKLYEWLKENNIPYKPKDRTKLKVSVDALLLGKYSNIVIQISEKPKFVSKKKYEETMQLRLLRAKETNTQILFLTKEDFENLNNLNKLLDDLKRTRDNMNNNSRKESLERKNNIKKTETSYIFNNIINYMIQIGCTTEDIVKEFINKYSDFYIEIIEKIFKKSLKTTDFDTKISLLKYVQNFIKETYYEGKNSERKILAQEILDELLSYIYVYSEEAKMFVKNNEVIIKELFKYPSGMWTESEYYFKRSKAGREYRKRGNLSETMYFLETISEKILLDNNIVLFDELLNLLYDSNQEYFNKLFNYLIKGLEYENKYKSRMQNVVWTNEQIEILKKWASCSTDNKINILKITNFENNTTEGKQYDNITDFLEIYKTNIVKYEENLIKILSKIKDKEQIYHILESLILAKDKNNNNDKYSYCFFRIIDLTLFYGKINSKCIYDDFIIDSLIDIAKDTTERDYHTMSVFLLIFNSYIEYQDNDKAIDFVKKIINRKRKLTLQFIKEILFYLKNHTDQTYINNVKEIIDYANLKGIKEADDLFKSQLKVSQIYNDKDINITDYILDINHNMSDEEIRACNDRIGKLMAPYNLKKIKIEEFFDFEKIIEHVIMNKNFFIHKDYDNIFDYVDWYFEGLVNIESEDILNSFIDNKIIYEDIVKIIKAFSFKKYTFEHKRFVSRVDLKRYIVILFSKKCNNQRIISLIQNYVNIIQDNQAKKKMLETIDIVNHCYDENYYKTSEDIEKIDNDLKSLGWDLNWGFYYDLYLDFLIKACGNNYQTAAKLMVKHNIVCDSIILEIYKVYGIEMVKKLVDFDINFKKKFLRNVDSKSKLILSIKSISEENVIDILKVLFENAIDEKNKYELIKKFLFSKNYRDNISQQELEYFKINIISMNSQKYKKELLHKWKLLAEKKGLK